MDNIVRIIVILDKDEEPRDIFDYLNLVPDIFTKRPKRYFEEQCSYYCENDRSFLLIRVSGINVAFESSGVWIVNYCGYEPPTDEVYEFAHQMESGSYAGFNIFPDRSQQWITTANGFAYKTTEDEAAFDSRLDKDSIVH